MTRLIEAMCAAGKQLDSLGLSPGTSGNISVREGTDVHMSPSGVSLGSLLPDALSRFSDGGERGARHVGGPKATKEAGLHDVFYRLNPDFKCVIHLHSSHAVAASCLPAWSEYSALPPITPYLLMRVGNMPMVPYAPPGDREQAQSLLGLVFRFNAVLLQNHGPVVGGLTVEDALARAIEVEEGAKITLAIGERSDVNLLNDEQARTLAARYDQPWGLG